MRLQISGGRTVVRPIHREWVCAGREHALSASSTVHGKEDSTGRTIVGEIEKPSATSYMGRSVAQYVPRSPESAHVWTHLLGRRSGSGPHGLVAARLRRFEHPPVQIALTLSGLP